MYNICSTCAKVFWQEPNEIWRHTMAEAVSFIDLSYKNRRGNKACKMPTLGRIKYLKTKKYQQI